MDHLRRRIIFLEIKTSKEAGPLPAKSGSGLSVYVTSGIHGGLLERSAGGLAAGMHAVGQDRLFEALAEMFGGKDASVSCAQIGQRLGMTEGALRGAMHRLRRRYRERLWAEVAQSVAPPDRVEDELRYLPTVVSQGS